MLHVLTRLRTRTYLAANRDRGATAVEYGLMVGLIAAVIVGAVALLGTKLNGYFGTVNSSL
ncbi:MAG: Flp family type IVb pilin [Actinomycetota bacterium]|nr:Flp family type IVb pilin [Actinomycetota bacterium]